MKKTLAASVLFLLVLGLAFTGTLRSQQKSPKLVPVKSPSRTTDLSSEETVDDPFSDRGAASDRTHLLDGDVRKLHVSLKNKIAQAARRDEAPFRRDAELEVALSKYLADGEISRVISVLEKVLESAPGTSEAEKAAAAIQVLKSGTQPNQTTPATPINPKGDAPARGPNPANSFEFGFFR